MTMGFPAFIFSGVRRFFIRGTKSVKTTEHLTRKSKK